MTIFFYILKEYIKYVLGTIVLTVFLFVLFDFIHKTTHYFAEFKPSTENIIRYYAFQLPGQIMQALPIASLLASVITMILLSRTNEVTAMRAAGMSAVRIGFPLAFGGILLSVLALLMGEWVLPAFAERVHYIQQVQIEGQKDDQMGGSKWLRNGENLINFEDFDLLTQTMTRVRVVEVRANFRPIQSLEAASALYIPETKFWRLKNIKVLHFKRNGTLDSIETRDTQDIDIPIEPKKLKKEWRKPAEMSFKELNEIVTRGDQSGIDTLPYKVDLHGKLAYPFAAFVVSLIGLKFGYKSERTTETAVGVLLAFCIGISYWFVMSAGRALGLRGALPPFVAAWLANVVILGIIMFDAWMARRL